MYNMAVEYDDQDLQDFEPVEEPEYEQEPAVEQESNLVDEPFDDRLVDDPYDPNLLAEAEEGYVEVENNVFVRAMTFVDPMDENFTIKLASA
jgi:hypothetical protein